MPTDEADTNNGRLCSEAVKRAGEGAGGLVGMGGLCLPC